MFLWSCLAIGATLLFSLSTVSAGTRIRVRQATPPVTATWAVWSDWTTCTVSCGGEGQTKRTRQCPLYGACGNPSDTVEKKFCGQEPCVTWGQWGEWGKCSTTCGTGGTVIRTRQCSVYGDKCVGDKTETKKCCCLPACPVWAAWQPWGACSTTCGPGQKIRTRQCSAYGGGCPGEKTESETCSVQPCCTPWTEWGSCSVSCGGGTQKRTQTCGVDTGKTVASGTSVGGYASKVKEEVLPCNNFTCPVWKPWTKATPCSQSCVSEEGKPPGVTVQSRECNFDTNYCVADKLTTAACKCDGPEKNTSNCNTFKCPRWQEWGTWSECSVSCTAGYGKGGFHTRNRECIVDKTYCVGEKLKTDLGCKCDKNCTTDGANATEPCNTFKCPKWQEWGSWSECSASCTAGYGTAGTHQQTRTCVNDAKYCVADKLETPACKCDGSGNRSESCNNFACPKWTEWSSWSECSASCTAGYGQSGTHTQTRECKIDTNYCKGDKLATSVCKCENNATTGEGANRTESCNKFACPQWSEWGSWSECSASCTSGYGSAGTHSQSRECKIDTTYCTGEKLNSSVCQCQKNSTTGEGGNRTEPCNKFACPKWTEWSKWTPCSVTCGGGQHSQSRECIIDKTYCVGEKLTTSACKCENNATTGEGANRTDSCNIFKCPGWSEWSSWGDCSLPCTSSVGVIGSHTRSRPCEVDSTYCKPEKLGNPECHCVGNQTETENCNNFACPTWNAWGKWSDCSLPCKANNSAAGTHIRERTCKVDSQANCSGGKTVKKAGKRVKREESSNNSTVDPCHCVGNESESESCNTFACPYWSEWSSWATCSVTCGGGTHQQTRKCITDSGYCTAEKLKNDTQCKCDGSPTNNETCSTDACPTYKAWSDWGSCSVTCGNGTTNRKRECSRTDAPCVGPASETQSCDKGPCYTWGSWLSWTECTVLCGGGSRNRSRKCPKEGGCPGLNVESSVCNFQPCPEWGAWSEWASCSVTCGGGQRARTRSCPLKNQCKPGNPFEIDPQKCNTEACPIWSEWTSWGSCSASCGEGNRRRNRTCSKGDGCPGRKEDVDPCSGDPCPLVIPLSPWSECSLTCGGGTKTRSKSACAEGPPKCGIEEESAPCSEQVCPVWEIWAPWTDCSATCGGGQRTRKRTCPVVNGCVGQATEIDGVPCNPLGCTSG